MFNKSIIVLAAGAGTRMKSDTQDFWKTNVILLYKRGFKIK